MIRTITFSEVRQSDSAMVHCPDCGKKRRLSVSRTYYRNGFHNESETWEKNRSAIARELEKLVSKGQICNACQDVRDNNPITRKLNDKEIEVIDRATGDVLGIIERTGWGGQAKFKCPGLRHTGGGWGNSAVYSGTIYEAADYYKDPTAHHLAKRQSSVRAQVSDNDQTKR